MTTALLPSVDELEKLFDKPALPCELVDPDTGKKCEHSADWRTITRCCGVAGFLCNDHYQHYLTLPPDPEGYYFECMDCGREWPTFGALILEAHKL
jgi:hypothetical protein